MIPPVVPSPPAIVIVNNRTDPPDGSSKAGHRPPPKVGGVGQSAPEDQQFIKKTKTSNLVGVRKERKSAPLHLQGVVA